MYYNKWRNLASSPRAQKKTRAVPDYLTVARMRQAVTIPSERLAAIAHAKRSISLPPFGQKEARNEHSELGLCSRCGFHADPDRRAHTETIL